MAEYMAFRGFRTKARISVSPSALPYAVGIADMAGWLLHSFPLATIVAGRIDWHVLAARIQAFRPYSNLAVTAS